MLCQSHGLWAVPETSDRQCILLDSCCTAESVDRVVAMLLRAHFSLVALQFKVALGCVPHYTRELFSSWLATGPVCDCTILTDATYILWCMLMSVLICAGQEACAVCWGRVPGCQQGAEGVRGQDWHPCGLNPDGAGGLPRQRRPCPTSRPLLHLSTAS